MRGDTAHKPWPITSGLGPALSTDKVSLRTTPYPVCYKTKVGLRMRACMLGKISIKIIILHLG